MQAPPRKKMMRHSLNYLSLKDGSAAVQIDEEIKTSKFMMEMKSF